jgi:hypothetical protein
LDNKSIIKSKAMLSLRGHSLLVSGAFKASIKLAIGFLLLFLFIGLN